jgi:hypothetical protein
MGAESKKLARKNPHPPATAIASERVLILQLPIDGDHVETSLTMPSARGGGVKTLSMLMALAVQGVTGAAMSTGMLKFGGPRQAVAKLTLQIRDQASGDAFVGRPRSLVRNVSSNAEWSCKTPPLRAPPANPRGRAG